MGRVPAIAAPTAAPTNPASEIGVLRTRLAPNLSMRPLVAPNAPSTTSSPKRKVSGSRDISSVMAWFMAWMKLICGMMVLRARRRSRKNVVGDFRRRGQFARACEFDRVGHFFLGVGDDRLEFGR